MSYILFVTNGSGGDVLPLLPLCQALEASGHRVALAAPKVLCLYARAYGLQTYPMRRDSDELGIHDAELLTTAADGRVSWSRYFERYVEPWIARDSQDLI